MRKKVIVFMITLSLLFSTIVFTGPTTADAQEIYATHGDRVVRTAKSYIGKVRYRYGVRNPGALIFDCSSFTQFVFRKNGHQIPWGSKAQTRFGIPVPSKSRLSIGDLVMFSVSTPGRINHVGIYVGNGKFIHNSPSSGVAISSLRTGYWSSRYITARHY